jgi:hypothetical protein
VSPVETTLSPKAGGSAGRQKIRVNSVLADTPVEADVEARCSRLFSDVKVK